MSEQLLDLLKLGLIALLYLFFLRVIWAVWTELRTPAVVLRAPAPSGPADPSNAKTSQRPRRSRKAPKVLLVVDPPQLRGGEYPLADEMTLGRAPGCTVVIDDTYVSQVHARIFANAAGEYQIEDLGSTNGTLNNSSTVTNPQVLKRGDRVQVGELVLEVS